MEPLENQALPARVAPLAGDVLRALGHKCEPGLAVSLREVFTRAGLINFELIGGLIFEAVECFAQDLGWSPSE